MTNNNVAQPFVAGKAKKGSGSTINTKAFTASPHRVQFASPPTVRPENMGRSTSPLLPFPPSPIGNPAFKFGDENPFLKFANGEQNLFGNFHKVMEDIGGGKQPPTETDMFSQKSTEVDKAEDESAGAEDESGEAEEDWESESESDSENETPELRIVPQRIEDKPAGQESPVGEVSIGICGTTMDEEEYQAAAEGLDADFKVFVDKLERDNQDAIIEEAVQRIFAEEDSKAYSTQLIASPGVCDKQLKPAYGQMKEKPASLRGPWRSRFEELLRDTESLKLTGDEENTTGGEEKHYSSWEKQLEYILCKKLDADLDLSNASHSLRAANSKLSEMHLEINHAVSKMNNLIRTLDLTTKERDELKSKLENLNKKPSVYIDVEPLRTSIARIQVFIEIFSAHFLKYLEENCYSLILPVWNHAPEAFKERYIYSVVSQRMFLGFENENFLVNEGTLTALDANALRRESSKIFKELSNKKVEDLKNEDNVFNQFYSEKKSGVLKEFRKSMLMGNIDISKAMQLDMKEMFDNMAKEVWALHKLALSMDGKIRILRAQKASTFDERWMTADVDSPERDDDVHESGTHKKIIQFMVMPGFQVEDIVISPCRVYI